MSISGRVAPARAFMFCHHRPSRPCSPSLSGTPFMLPFTECFPSILLNACFCFSTLEWDYSDVNGGLKPASLLRTPHFHLPAEGRDLVSVCAPLLTCTKPISSSKTNNKANKLHGKTWGWGFLMPATHLPCSPDQVWFGLVRQAGTVFQILVPISWHQTPKGLEVTLSFVTWIITTNELENPRSLESFSIRARKNREMSILNQRCTWMIRTGGHTGCLLYLSSCWVLLPHCKYTHRKPWGFS